MIRLRDDAIFDRRMMQWLVAFSSSDTSRGLAAAWLETFDAALAAGADEDEAHARANARLERSTPRWPES